MNGNAKDETDKQNNEDEVTNRHEITKSVRVSKLYD